MPVGSPCVRRCCLDDKDICLGCHRTLQEILDWHTDDDKKKQQTIERTEQRKQLVKPLPF